MSKKLKSIRATLVFALLLFVGSIQAQTIKVNVKDSSGEAGIGASVMAQATALSPTSTVMPLSSQQASP